LHLQRIEKKTNRSYLQFMLIPALIIKLKTISTSKTIQIRISCKIVEILNYKWFMK